MYFRSGANIQILVQSYLGVIIINIVGTPLPSPLLKGGGEGLGHSKNGVTWGGGGGGGLGHPKIWVPWGGAGGVRNFLLERADLQSFELTVQDSHPSLY